MHSSSCFRKLSESDTARLLETPTLKHRTASRVLSVVYATENTGKMTELFRHWARCQLPIDRIMVGMTRLLWTSYCNSQLPNLTSYCRELWSCGPNIRIHGGQRHGSSENADSRSLARKAQRSDYVPKRRRHSAQIHAPTPPFHPCIFLQIRLLKTPRSAEIIEVRIPLFGKTPSLVHAQD
jgi:hypothetical protein